MKWILLVLAVVAVAESRQVCVPNTTWKMSCNTCFCTADGTSTGCTLMACPDESWKMPLPKNDEVKIINKRSYSSGQTYETVPRQSIYGRECQPGTVVNHYCNTCMCRKDGRVGRCTKMFCGENMYNMDGTLRYNRPAGRPGVYRNSILDD